MYIHPQKIQALKNITVVLEEAGSGLQNMLKVSAYLQLNLLKRIPFLPPLFSPLLPQSNTTNLFKTVQHLHNRHGQLRRHE